MNKKGNMFLGIILGLIIYISGVLFIPFITDDVTTTRNDLNCTNSSISDGNKLSCLAVDIVVPYIIWFFVSIAIGFIMGGST